MFTLSNRAIKLNQSGRGHATTGFALIELMIGSVLSLFLLSILISVYLTCERSYRLQSSLNHINENAVVAAFILKTEMRKAGHIGCPRLTFDFPMINFPPYTITAQNKLMETSIATSMGPRPALIVRYADFPNASLIKPVEKRDMLYTTDNISFKPGNILIISDCHHAEMVKVKKVSHFQNLQQMIITNPLQSSFSRSAEISRLIINKYFIAKTNDKGSNDSNYSLFVEDIQNRKHELVNGINKMELLFSMIEDGNMIDFPAHAINDWSKVKGVAIKLEVGDRQFKKYRYLYVAIN